jgi:hypothetical protein
MGVGRLDAIVNSLRADELDLLRETEPARMAELDEDALLDLHGRVRRARTKYVKLYRRQASVRVAGVGGRGLARPQNRRNADKAEVFETALARVSKQVDVVARRAAAQLKAERLAAARAAPKPSPATSDRKGAAGSKAKSATRTGTGSGGRARVATKTTGGVKRDASSRAMGARRQAARDSR